MQAPCLMHPSLGCLLFNTHSSTQMSPPPATPAWDYMQLPLFHTFLYPVCLEAPKGRVPCEVSHCCVHRGQGRAVRRWDRDLRIGPRSSVSFGHQGVTMGQKSMFGDTLDLNQGRGEMVQTGLRSERLGTPDHPVVPSPPMEEARAATDEGWAGTPGTLVLGWCL